MTDDHESKPPYPSYDFDQFRREQAERQMATEHDEKITRWRSGIQSDLEGFVIFSLWVESGSDCYCSSTGMD
jgi:hypothetical protein